MPGLTDNEARAIAYFAIGVSSEGGDQAYHLGFAGNTTRNAQGQVELQPVANSGYSIGTLQSDLGQSGGVVATQMVDAYQQWARTEHPDWALGAQQRSQAIDDLSRNGHQIRAEHGRDLDPTVKTHLNSFLASEAGINFVHGHDAEQTQKLMTDVVAPLRHSQLYQHASADDQARLIAIAAKAYNQSERWGGEVVRNIGNGTYHSVADVSGAIDHMPDYMQSGRDAALRGAELFNGLQHSAAANPLHAPWQNVLANPLVNPNRTGHDAAHPHLTQEYQTIKDAFVDPAHGRQLLQALEQQGSYNYGNPASANSRGFYAEGRDFVEWNRAGHGRAFVNEQWRDIERGDLSRNVNADGTLDLHLRRQGRDETLLHVVHPTDVRRHAAPAHGDHAQHPQHAAPAHGDHVQHPGSLREHDRGTQVHELQAQLAALGYRDAQGRPLVADGGFGPGTRSALESFQRDHHLHADGIAGRDTMAAIQRATHEHAAPALTDAAHPGNAMYRQAQESVHQVDARQGRAPDQRSDNLAGALAVAAKAHGLSRIDHVVLSDDASRAFAVQGDLNSPFKRYAEVSVAQAIATPVAQSGAHWQQAAQQANSADLTRQQAQQQPSQQPQQPGMR